MLYSHQPTVNVSRLILTKTKCRANFVIFLGVKNLLFSSLQLVVLSFDYDNFKTLVF